MIVVDTSALLAIALAEPEAGQCRKVLVAASEILISAGTLTETLIVAARKNVGERVDALLEALSLTVVHTTETSARRAAAAYKQWGKGFHPAGLNLGDCFAYELAKDRNCPLLFIGNDFSQTDVISALDATDIAG